MNNERSLENAIAIVNDALLEAGIWDFIFTDFPDMKLSAGVYFMSAAPLKKIASALYPIMLSRDIGYDDQVAAPITLYQVELKHIFSRCFRPRNLERIRREERRVETQHDAYVKSLTPAEAAEHERAGKALAETMTVGIKNMLAKQQGGDES